jgi:hypothetical protein
MARAHKTITTTTTTMFHVMESPYNNNSSSTELKKTPAYLRPPRRPLKETPPPWKDALKHSCLERARRERQKDAISSRRRHCHFHDFHHERARNVVQEELHECGIGIRRGGGGEEMEQVTQRHCTSETPRENDKEQQQQDDDEYEISQDELYELMQQVEEELLRQGTSLVSRKYFVYQ